jgi:hypothetical protein
MFASGSRVWQQKSIRPGLPPGYTLGRRIPDLGAVADGLFKLTHPTGESGMREISGTAEAERREVFRSLYEDPGRTAAEARAAAAERYELSLEEVRLIEWEGVGSGWPPL